MANQPSKLDSALALAARGFRVFPLRAGDKKPLPDFDWTRRATTDAATIKAWWLDPHTGWAQDHNIGVMTGTPLADGYLLVLDVDNKGEKHGGDTLAALEARHGALPATMRVRTPSGGLHVYLVAPYQTANSVDRLGHGLDTRGHNGYVVGPGSVVEAGAYEVIP